MWFNTLHIIQSAINLLENKLNFPLTVIFATATRSDRFKKKYIFGVARIKFIPKIKFKKNSIVDRNKKCCALTRWRAITTNKNHERVFAELRPLFTFTPRSAPTNKKRCRAGNSLKKKLCSTVTRNLDWALCISQKSPKTHSRALFN